MSDALSGLPSTELMNLTISSVSTDMLEMIKNNYVADFDYSRFIKQIQKGEGPSRFGVTEGLLRRKGEIIIGNDAELRTSSSFSIHRI